MDRDDYVVAPVIDREPTLGKTIMNMKPKDIGMIGVFVAASWTLGYFTGGPIRRQHTIACVSLGGFGGFLFAIQNSYGRLIGERK